MKPEHLGWVLVLLELVVSPELMLVLDTWDLDILSALTSAAKRDESAGLMLLSSARREKVVGSEAVLLSFFDFLSTDLSFLCFLAALSAPSSVILRFAMVQCSSLRVPMFQFRI